MLRSVYFIAAEHHIAAIACQDGSMRRPCIEYVFLNIKWYFCQQCFANSRLFFSPVSSCIRLRGPPRPRPVRDGEEDKENQGGEGGPNQQARQRRPRRPLNYRRRRPQSGGKPGPETKEAKTGGDTSAEKTSAPEAQQGGAE